MDPRLPDAAPAGGPFRAAVPDVVDLIDLVVDDPMDEGASDEEPEERRAWYPVLLASVGALLVVVASATAVLTALGQSRAAERALSSSRVADAYQDALYAATVEQSLERAVRLTSDVRLVNWHREAGQSVERALVEVERTGGPAHQPVVDQVRERHDEYASLIPVGLGTSPGAATADRQAVDRQAVDASEDVQDLLSGAAQESYREADQVRQDAASNARTTATAQSVAVGVLLLVLAGSASLAFSWWRRLRREQRRTGRRSTPRRTCRTC